MTGREVSKCWMYSTTVIASTIAPRMIPVSAMPLPVFIPLDCLIFDLPMKPKMTPRIESTGKNQKHGIAPMMLSTMPAVACPLVDGCADPAPPLYGL
jgi:hypothetical protein